MKHIALIVFIFTTGCANNNDLLTAMETRELDTSRSVVSYAGISTDVDEGQSDLRIIGTIRLSTTVHDGSMRTLITVIHREGQYNYVYHSLEGYLRSLVDQTRYPLINCDSRRKTEYINIPCDNDKSAMTYVKDFADNFHKKRVQQYRDQKKTPHTRQDYSNDGQLLRVIAYAYDLQEVVYDRIKGIDNRAKFGIPVEGVN